MIDKRPRTSSLALVVAGVFAASVPASAAVDARLAGDFKITGKITDSNDGTQGKVKSRLYGFRALCPAGPCRKVSLRREGPQNTFYRSILRRKRSGVYKGTEQSGRVTCPNGRRGTQEVKLRFWIVREEDGLATTIKGRARFDSDCPGGDLFQKARLYGERR